MSCDNFVTLAQFSAVISRQREASDVAAAGPQKAHARYAWLSLQRQRGGWRRFSSASVRQPGEREKFMNSGGLRAFCRQLTALSSKNNRVNRVLQCRCQSMSAVFLKSDL